MTRRVVITGVGAVTPVGSDVPSAWQALLAGRSGVDRITLFDASPFAVQIAGEVKGFALGDWVEPKERRRLDRNVQFALAATAEALRDAGLDAAREPTERIGVILGSCVGGIATFGLRGPNMAVVSACATGGHAIGEAAETIRRGDADVAIAGGTEAALVPLVLAGFIIMRALSDRNDEPAAASRPFDRTRDGFVMSEGAAIMVLEDLERALARGARIYAEVVGYGSTNDAFHMAAPSEGGDGAARTIAMALQKAKLPPEIVHYCNAHGTSTPLNDRFETLAIKRVFGDHAYRLAVSSTKSMTGHMMGAAGAFEALVCALVLRDQILPPTINYREPDPECDLDYVPNVARRATVEAALSNAFGLGGHNPCVLLRRYQDARRA
ncbi:MAG: beta-ketoacyl-[acyl-carrier-protein] synthase II [Chloroflexi bacterium]|nr:beta-ketoacyl-[acyl-carrier-protein] synthase II [Chloroflexota bacterium]